MSTENSGLKVHCIVTGKQGYLGGDFLKKKIEIYGTADEVAKHYISRQAAILLRAGKTQETIRSELAISNDGFVSISEDIIEAALGERRKKSDNPNAPDANGQYWWQKDTFKVQRGWDQKSIDVETTTKETCLRPDVYLDERCEPCPYFSRCTLPIRLINGKVPKVEKI